MKHRRTKKKGGDCCLYENETIESCKGNGPNPEGSSRKNRDFYSEIWNLSWKGRGHRVQLNIKYHALKHMDSIGINCYEETPLVEWIKSNLIDANVFGNNIYPYYGIDSNTHKIIFTEFVDYFYSKKPPLHKNEFVAYQPIPKPPNSYNPANKYKIVFNAYKLDKILIINVFHISKINKDNLTIYDCNFNDVLDLKTCPITETTNISSTSFFPALVSPTTQLDLPLAKTKRDIGPPPGLAIPVEESILSALPPPIDSNIATVTPPTIVMSHLNAKAPPFSPAFAATSSLNATAPVFAPKTSIVTPYSGKGGKKTRRYRKK
jgi:hypothetical protein